MFFCAFFPFSSAPKTSTTRNEICHYYRLRLADFFCPDLDGVFFSSSRWEHKINIREFSLCVLHLALVTRSYGKSLVSARFLSASKLLDWVKFAKSCQTIALISTGNFAACRRVKNCRAIQMKKKKVFARRNTSAELNNFVAVRRLNC